MKKMAVIQAIFLAVLAESISTASASCDDGWLPEPTSGSCFMVLREDEKTHAEAKAQCEEMSAHLPRAKTDELLNFILDNSYKWFWLDLDKQNDGSYAWGDGEAVDFTKWGGRAVKRHGCVWARGQNTRHGGKWRDTPCEGHKRAHVICQKAASPSEPEAACPQPTQGLGQAACDVELDSARPWTLLQRRTTGEVAFDRTWQEYKDGFGAMDNDYWVGLDAIHELCPQLEDCEARFEFTWDGETQSGYDVTKSDDGRYVLQYGKFAVAGEDESYKLTIDMFDQDASTPTIDDRLEHHNGWGFSTKDVDNDARSTQNCAQSWGGNGGWWFNSCHRINLNGIWEAGNQQGISFYSVTGSHSGTSSRILIRPSVASDAVVSV